jgi:dTDP-4-dehydrorhamnose reductase
MSKKSILVLGSASWLGSLFLSRLDKKEFSVKATYYNTFLNFDKSIDLVEAKLLSKYKPFVDSVQPDFIVNFLRTDNHVELDIHKELIGYCEENLSCQYIVCSSVLALDGYKNRELTEDLLANSISEYGIFKSKCEEMLYDSKINYSILRFASLQGYCKHKIIRNEYLLKQLKNGETIKVDQKVIQNRMFAEDATDLIVKIIEQKKTGIIHLGTTDSSDEIDFLREQAVFYGYNYKKIIHKKYIRNVNLNCIPKKIHELNPLSKKFTEADTLSKIFGIEEYSKYKASHVG